MKISLYINGEVARIEDNEKYYILNNDVLDWEYLQEVDKKTFVDYMKKLENLCTTTWDKELQEQYKKIMEVIK